MTFVMMTIGIDGGIFFATLTYLELTRRGCEKARTNALNIFTRMCNIERHRRDEAMERRSDERHIHTKPAGRNEIEKYKSILRGA